MDGFYQNVGYYPAPPPPSNPVNTPVRTYVPYSNSAGNISNSTGALRPPNFSNSMLQRGPPPNLNPSYLNEGSAQHWHENRLQSQLQFPQAQINQNLMRQEAKMLEMQDELRRREERAALMMRKEQNFPGKLRKRNTVSRLNLLPIVKL